MFDKMNLMEEPSEKKGPADVVRDEGVVFKGKKGHGKKGKGKSQAVAVSKKKKKKKIRR